MFDSVSECSVCVSGWLGGQTRCKLWTNKQFVAGSRKVCVWCAAKMEICARSGFSITWWRLIPQDGRLSVSSAQNYYIRGNETVVEVCVCLLWSWRPMPYIIAAWLPLLAFLRTLRCVEFEREIQIEAHRVLRFLYVAFSAGLPILSIFYIITRLHKNFRDFQK